MDDQQIHQHINDLVAEEHRLERSHPGREQSDAQRQRLEWLGVELDRLWDLLRQRDARRRAGMNPDEAQQRPADVVEEYRQ